LNDKVPTIPVGNSYEPTGKYGLLNMLGIKFEERNLNPNGDERAEDCVVRSILMVLNHVQKAKDVTYTWEYVYDKLSSIGRKHHRLMNNYWVVKEFLEEFGFQLVVPIKNVQLGTFLITHTTNSYIVSFNDHAFAYINGTIYDTKSMLPEISYNLSMPLKAIYVPKNIIPWTILKE